MTTKVTPNLIDAPLGTRNVIINGNLGVWQRGTSFASAASGTFTADRFKYNKSGAMVHQLSQGTSVPTYAESGIISDFSLRADCTTIDTSLASTDKCLIRYTVEGYDYARLAGGDATLSFWVKATKTGIHCIGFKNAGSDRSYVIEYTINTTDTWEKKILTVPLTETAGTWDYTNGSGIQILFTLAVGSAGQTTAGAWQTGDFIGTSNQVNACDNTANQFYITQVQLEKGDVATEFEYKSVADEFAKCQRYYETGKIYYSGPTTGLAGASIPHVYNSAKRDIATIAFGTATTSGTGFTGTVSSSSTYARDEHFYAFFGTNAVGGGSATVTFEADAEL